MTELTNAPERQSRDPMDSDSDTRGVRPNLKRHWNRRWRRYLFALFALIPAIFLTLMAIFVMRSPNGCHLVGYIPFGGTTVGFDVTQVLANLPEGGVQVQACVEGECVRHAAYPIQSASFWVSNAALTDPEPVDVRVVELDEEQPNGPGCEPTFFSAGVQATPEGDLIQQ